MPLFNVGPEMPPRIDICTQAAYRGSKHYPYDFNATTQCYVSEMTTQNGSANEVIVLGKFDMADGFWFVAVEGEVIEGAFKARQMAFRTQAVFWEAGLHGWQMNSANCSEVSCPHPDWDLHSVLYAETKVPYGGMLTIEGGMLTNES
jgi:hypothetical protein